MRFAALTERIARKRAEIEAAEHRWLEVAEMAEAMAANRSQADRPPPRGPLADAPLEDRQRHRAFLQHLVEPLDVELRRRASSALRPGREPRRVWPTL